MKNCPEWMIAFIAIINAGGVAVLINSRGTGETMSRAIGDADCVLVIADDKRLQRLNEAGYDGASLSGQDFPKPITDFTPTYAKSQDLAAMFFTSGTTGVAKAAAIQHRALITGMMNTQMAMAAVFQKMAHSYNIDIETLRAQMPQSCSLLIFPLFHTSGCSAVFMTALTTGGKLVLMDRWDADEALALIEREKISAFGGVPTMHWDLLRSPNFGKHDLSSLMSVSCGGQALPLNLLAEIREAFPQAYIGAGYGMTETCGAISQANGEAFLANPSASGQILPMVDVQIVGDDGEVLPAGKVGEIWAKGATLMQGYYGRPEDTQASMSGEWFKTGDIGRLDESGYIYIVDRKTDMVISGGENIYCAEVEQIMGRHPGILAIGTFGVSDDRLGERLVACLQVKEGISTEDILTFAKDNLADYKVPTDITVQSDPFELNALGKIQKFKLRAAYLARKEKEQVV
jgi:acyl-CoA synthetase (AMP-forming)/AMP-acid ligase II